MGKPLRLLLIEDSEDDAFLLHRELRRGGYEPMIERVETAEAMQTALSTQEWDVVISDYVLPKFSGLAALSVFKESGLDLPFIMVSGNIGEDIAVEAMRAGAHDYIMKGNLARLVPAVEREIRDAEVRKKRTLSEADRIRLTAAIEAASDAIVITDTTGCILYINPAFEQITGYSKYEAIGQDLASLSKGEHNIIRYDEIWSAVSHGETWSGHLTSLRKDGTSYEEDVTVSPVKDTSGKTSNYVFVKRDMTERRRLESIAEAANTMNNIGYVFAGVRHEIGNPVNTIKMTLNVLKMGLDRYDKERILDYIERSLGELSRIEYLLKNLKNYNMHERPELQNVTITDFIDKFIMLVKADFSLGKNIRVSRSIEPGAEYVYADPRALHQVLLNVFTNAADALEGRENPMIDVSVSCLPGALRICVEDNGCGMTEEQQSGLFKPFHTTKAKGTGLGLIITQKMLMGMNGSIEITSRPNAGTSVSIVIPEGVLPGPSQ